MRRVAVTGAAGRLGRELVAELRRAGDSVLALARPEFDITRADDLARLARWNPDIVINAAAWTDVDGCARDSERARQINGIAAGAVAEAAARAGAMIVQISTNEVFDGQRESPYVEDDQASPVNPYGASKLLGEELVARANPRHLIVRTAWLFGPTGSSFATKILRAAEQASSAGAPLRVVADEWGNPTWVPSLTAGLVGALGNPALAGCGILHLAGTPAVSRFGWAQALMDAAGLAVTLDPVRSATFARPSRPPLRAVLATAYQDAAALWDDWRPHAAKVGAESREASNPTERPGVLRP